MDFSLILFIALVVTGIIVLLDHFILAPRRRLTTVSSENIGGNTEQNEAYSDRNMPLYVEYAKAFFPVILLVFTLRSFVIEPFRIPSGSMYPTLNIGDIILFNKFQYGL